MLISNPTHWLWSASKEPNMQRAHGIAVSRPVSVSIMFPGKIAIWYRRGVRVGIRGKDFRGDVLDLCCCLVAGEGINDWGCGVFFLFGVVGFGGLSGVKG
jgi:hypothetical protein